MVASRVSSGMKSSIWKRSRGDRRRKGENSVDDLIYKRSHKLEASTLCLLTSQIGKSMPSSHVATSYVAEVTNPNFDIWKWLWLHKERNTCSLNTETRGTKVPHIALGPKLHSFLRYDRQAILSYKPFWAKCTEWPQNCLEHYKVNITP